MLPLALVSWGPCRICSRHLPAITIRQLTHILLLSQTFLCPCLGRCSSQCVSLGILDIFGFEDFETNSLEQLLINITNEQLQNYFNNFIFTMELAEYEREGIDFTKITFDDNQPTLDLLLKVRAGAWKPHASAPSLFS